MAGTSSAGLFIKVISGDSSVHPLINVSFEIQFLFLHIGSSKGSFVAYIYRININFPANQDDYLINDFTSHAMLFRGVGCLKDYEK